jgi:predicted exporter
MTWVGGGATLGILLLLLLAFRRWRVLLAFVPVLVGMLFGAVACVALFGHMHVMTLVLGSSLIGVAVDYPLHYLSKSWSLKPWHSWPALRLTLPGLTLSLITSAIGYLALAWTPFPALTQIAVFSAAGLLGAYLARCACCRRCSRRRAAPGAVAAAHRANPDHAARTPAGQGAERGAAGAGAAFCAAGLAPGQPQRHSPVGRQPAAVAARGPGRGAHHRLPAHQPVLPGARRQSAATARTPAALSGKLGELVKLDKLKGYMSLSQLVASPANSPAATSPRPLPRIGSPCSTWACRRPPGSELQHLQQLPPKTSTHAGRPAGRSLAALWLGPTATAWRRWSACKAWATRLLRLQTDDLPGVQLVDRLGELNQCSPRPRSAPPN